MRCASRAIETRELIVWLVGLEEDDEDIPMFAGVKCCKGPLFGAAMITLCIVDWLHVILAIVFMVSVANDNSDGDNVGATVGACLYFTKVVTHMGLVVVRLCKGDAKKDLTTRWREDQEWFVSMTFNSFMMLFVHFFIDSPWVMVRIPRASLMTCCVLFHMYDVCQPCCYRGGLLTCVGFVFIVLIQFKKASRTYELLVRCTPVSSPRGSGAPNPPDAPALSPLLAGTTITTSPYVLSPSLPPSSSPLSVSVRVAVSMSMLAT
jgi:hypothetical protein